MTTYRVLDGTLVVEKDIVDLRTAKMEGETYLLECKEVDNSVTIYNSEDQRECVITLALEYS